MNTIRKNSTTRKCAKTGSFRDRSTTHSTPRSQTVVRGRSGRDLKQASEVRMLKGKKPRTATQDMIAIKTFKEKLARGEEELIPADVAERLILGDEHPIRVWRDYRGLKAKELAEMINVSPNFLSMVEHNKKDGSLKFYVKAARVLNVRLDDLVPDDID